MSDTETVAHPQTVWTRDPRPVVAFDWAVAQIHVTFDGQNVVTMLDTDELVAHLGGVPHKLVAEATFESYKADMKAARLERLRAAGHELYVFRPLRTGRMRHALDVTKTHTHDAQLIWHIANDTPGHLYPLPDIDAEWVATREELNFEYGLLRAAGRKAELVAKVEDILGPYSSLEGDTRLVLTNGKEYAASVVAAVYYAATNTLTRAEFERHLGLHGSGYPTLLRSDIHHHGFRHAKKRGVTWTVFRREVRRLRSVILAHEAAAENATA
jgi:hypothetical protein